MVGLADLVFNERESLQSLFFCVLKPLFNLISNGAKFDVKRPLKIQIDRIECFRELGHHWKVHAVRRITLGWRDIKLGLLEVDLEVDVLELVHNKLLLLMLWVKGTVLVRCYWLDWEGCERVEFLEGRLILIVGIICGGKFGEIR